MKVALIYDWVNTFGGAERILLELHKLYPKAPLFTTVYDKEFTPWADVFKIKTTFIQKIAYLRRHHELTAVVTPIAFESFNFSQFDLVISITSGFAKGVITKPQTLHLCYLLTPVRYLWSHEEYYFQNRLLHFLSLPMVKYLKKWDLVAKTRPDYFLAISQTVQKRIKDYYHLDCEILYPPVLIDKFKKTNKWNSDLGFFLIVSRLVPHKQIDLAIHVCNKLKKKLIIIGRGRSEVSLKKIAGSTIKFFSNLTDEELISYYQNCRALILPSEEDFGIVAVEAQAAGKPVIAYSCGGSRETVLENVTGIFFPKQTIESLTEAIKRFEKITFSPINCRNNAQKFTKTRFSQEFNSKVKTLYNLYQVKY